MLCFQLTNKHTGEVATLNKVDEEICELLGEPVNQKKYCPIFKWQSKVSFGIIEHAISWYDTIGLALASGKSYNECREITTNNNALKVIDYLEANYTVNNWYECK